ncbi:MBL fold metallo-hydrolase [Olleya aquimaris]|uniref:L-ascorbate metabolism protein UlaG (Beta-lactamase superfamily) n=1 Tax=Olleya aquimaris TaxID=639310 RepID=A0A327RJF3_9FLAO|nr:MBL fold metallo-hydrolase [Olleya aquimaris]RAJ16275.1 L-ascorbate metabolism protein UlaG (beta-lactamase superfamily) [Olleya aquimaris]
MKKLILAMFTITLMLSSCKNETKTDTSKLEENKSLSTQNDIEIIPISHATMVLNYEDHTIYADPTGGGKAFEGQKTPTIILITDIHGDHLNLDTLKELDLNNSLIVAPQAVIDKFPEDFKPMFRVLNNGQSAVVKDIPIEAIPMYNLPEDDTSRHPKGRGNGYIVTLGEKRVYISGDTEDIPEMRNLKNIDKAFVCMNLPYTMTVDSAASAVLDFKPKQVYPFHYRGKGGLSDVARFKTLVNEGNPDIEVVQLDWYPRR